MGGAKKKGIAQMEKSQQTKEAKDKKKGKPAAEKKPSFGAIPDADDEGVIKELARMKAITSTSAASQFGIRVSVAKQFLEELARRQVVTLVAGSSRLKIYSLVKPQSS
ncbi:MAG: hypothetical protein ACE5PO_09625 [Candidatus Bathyarchaeia archaeon]